MKTPGAAGEPGAGVTVEPMPHRVLVVATAPDPSDELLEYLDKYDGDDLEVAVVAPASDVSLLEWMAEDEDRARREADRRAREAAEAEALAAKVVDVEVGDPDAVLAVEDALRRFPADELVVVTRPKQVATWLERAILSGELQQFGLPITHLIDDDVDGWSPPAGYRDSFVVRSVLRNLYLTLVVFVGIVIAVVLTLYYTLG
jgi:hypothetical protein